MQPTTQSLRHPLTRTIHFAPRIKTARRFTAKNPWWQNDFLEGGRIKFPKRFCMVGTRYFASATNCWYPIWYYNNGRTWSIESTEKVQFFKDQNEKCLRFITFLSTNRLNKAMIGRKRRVKRQFLRYKLSIWKLVLLFQCFRLWHVSNALIFVDCTETCRRHVPTL